jgi:hypothetical protein
VGTQQGLDLLTQRGIAGAGFIEVRRPLFGARQGRGTKEDRFGAIG